MCLLSCSILACGGGGGGSGDSVSLDTVPETSTGTETDGSVDTRLFDETGVWALERYTLDGGPYLDIAQNRKGLFLLRFKPEDGVVATAACSEQNTEVDVNASNCTNAALATWTCRCFAYTYEGDQMVWQEFVPGHTPPAVGGPAAHVLFVGEDPGGDAAGQRFGPLPESLYNSDGETSQYVFQRRNDAVWTMVDKNGDGVLDLQSCSAGCFPSGL